MAVQPMEPLGIQSPDSVIIMCKRSMVVVVRQISIGRDESNDAKGIDAPSGEWL